MDYDRFEIEDDSYYLFTCAELKAREIEFLERARLERMLDSEDINAFLKILGETVYSSNISGIQEKLSFDELIIDSYQGILSYLDESLKSDHKTLGSILFFEEILHNMKVIFKAIVLEKDLRSLFIPIIYDYDQLIGMYESDDCKEGDELPARLMKSLKDINEKPGDKDFREMELGFEKIYMEAVVDIAKDLNRKMISEYICHRIDLINIENIYRWKYLKEKDGFENILHREGNISLDILKSFKSETMDFMVKELERTDYGDIIIKGAQFLTSDCSFSSFERNRDLYFLDYFNNFRYSISNLEKIFHFFLKKKIELGNLNILFTGILYNADKSNIKCKID